MANKKANEEDGVWRTIGGRRVFIRNGQSLADAMKESGKFSNLNKNVSSHNHPSEVKKLDDKHSYKVEEGNPLEEMANERMNEKKQEYEKDLDYVNRILKGEKVIDDKYNEELSLDVAKKWLRDDYVYLNGLSSYSPEEIDAKLEKDLPDIFGKEETKEDEKNVAKNDIIDFRHQLTQAESDYYNDLSPNEVYELGMKLTEQRALDERQMNIKGQANKLLDSIDRANKKGSGYADKQTEKLRELLKSSKDMLNPMEELPESWTKYKEDSQIYKDWNKLTGKINDEVDYKNEELPEIVDNYLQKEGFTEDNGYSKEYIKNLKDNAVSSLHYTEYDKNELSNFGITDEDIKNAEEYSKTVNRRPWNEIKKEQDDYEYNLYKQSREDPDSINPMTEWSTDWEKLDKKYRDRYDKEFKASMGEVDIPEDFTAQFNDYAKKHDDLRLAKEKALQTKKDAENKWIEHYNNSNWNDENWRKEDDRLQAERDKSREEYDKAMKEYLAVANDNELSWEDKVARNDIRQEEELKKYSNFRNDEERDKYYEVFRKYERENAKLKAEGAKPEDEYIPLNSWGSFHNKMEELMKDNENAKWTGKEYTNDEFMEHLEDANWHTERRMLETAGLTNQEMEYIKNHTTLAAWSADLDRDKTQKLINEAKEKFRNNDKMNEINRKIADHLQNVSNVAKRMGDEKNARTNQLASDYASSQITSNTQSTNDVMNNAIRQSVSKKSKTSKSTSQRYSGTLAYLKEMGLTQHTIDEIIKRMEEDNKK